MRGRASIFVADYTLMQAAKSGSFLTPSQIMRLVFITHGMHLALAGQPLVRDRIDMWKTGPVIPVLHHEMVICGNRPVDSLLYAGTPADSNMFDGFFHTLLSDIERGIIEGAVKEYGGWTGPEPAALCREPSSQWDRCYTGKYGAEILDSVMWQYYESEMVALRPSR